jgi:hypothetical protein
MYGGERLIRPGALTVYNGWDHELHHSLALLIAYTDRNGGAHELKAQPRQLQYDALGPQTWLLCVQEAQKG